MRCLLLLARAILASECLLVPTVEGPNGVAACLDQAAAVPFGLEISVAAEDANRRLLGCQLTIQIEGSASRTSKEALTNAMGVVATAKTVFAPQLGKLKEGTISVQAGSRQCSHEWGCQTVTVRDDYRSWKFDCEGTLSRPGDEIKLSMSGAKPYKIRVVTDPLPQSVQPSKAFVSLRMMGIDGLQSADIALVAAGRIPGIAQTLMVTSRDVGPTLKSINITNHSAKDPWRFRTITITSSDGVVAKFEGAGQYIGTPYSASRVFSNHFFSDSGSSTVIHVECHTRLLDIITGEINQPLSLQVRCPVGCDSNPLAYVAGLSLHPGASSICASAVADGAIGISGGQVQLQLYPSDSRDLTPLYLNVSRIGIHPYRDASTAYEARAYYTTARVDSLDDLNSNLRVVDVFAELAHTGRLEMRSSGGIWGSVCKQGVSEAFSVGAARVACQEMGYLWGSTLDSSCSAMNLCAPKTMLVAAGGIVCRGTEDKLSECAIQEPAPECADHTQDVLIHCSDTPPTTSPASGTLRLIDAGGMPAVRGIGRLEIFMAHSWGSVCDDGWTRADAGVACRELGYSTARDLGESADAVTGLAPCDDVMGGNYCGPTGQRIAITEVLCDGTEGRLRDCALSAPDDVYCVHSEDVVLSCEGSGDPSGVGMFATEHVPRLAQRYLKPQQSLRCTDTFDSLFAKHSPKPGELYTVRCPANCARVQAAAVIGTYLYDWESSICRSAVHAGATDDTGQVFLVAAAHGQHQFTPSVRRGVISIAGGAAENSFHAVQMSEAMSARVLPAIATADAAQDGGFSLLPDSFMQNRANYERNFTGISFLETVASPTPLVAFCNEGGTLARFDGSDNGVITLNHLPGGNALSALTSFTVIIHFRTARRKSAWSSLMSYGECDGFNILLDSGDQVVLEQLCTTLALSTKVLAAVDKWVKLSVVYSHEKRTLTIYSGADVMIAEEPVLQPFRWTSHLRLGKSSILEYEPFFGEISQALIYDQPLTSPMITSITENLRAVCSRLEPPETVSQYSTQSYRICMSDCSAGGKNARIMARKQAGRIELAARPAIPIDCISTLDNTPGLAGRLDEELEVVCPLSCLNDALAHTATKLDSFPGSFPICRAASVLGFVPKTSQQRIRVKILNGRLTYLPSHFAPADFDSGVMQQLGRQYDIRSYTVTAVTEPRTLPCTATADFILFASNIHEQHLFRCPSGCRGTAEQKPEAKRVKQLHSAQPAQGVLPIYNATTAICAAAIDHNLLTTEHAGDVLVSIEPLPVVAEAPTERSRSDVLADVMSAIQLPFTDTNQPQMLADSLSRGYRLEQMPLSPKCPERLTLVSPGDMSTDYYCAGPVSLRGQTSELPAVVRIPQLSLSVLFERDACRLTDLLSPVDVARARSVDPPRTFHINLQDDYSVVGAIGMMISLLFLQTSWMETGNNSTVLCQKLAEAIGKEPFTFLLLGGAIGPVTIHRLPS